MFEDSKAISSFSADDIAKVKTFYGDTLHIRVSDGPMGMLMLHLAGGTDVMVYPKENHAPASFTVLNLRVDDIDKAVDTLTERGVELEEYGTSDQDARGIARGDGPPIAWFKDPAGNILSVLQA